MHEVAEIAILSDRLNTPPIQRYVHQFTDELQNEFEALAAVLAEFADVGKSATTFVWKYCYTTWVQVFLLLAMNRNDRLQP